MVPAISTLHSTGILTLNRIYKTLSGTGRFQTILWKTSPRKKKITTGPCLPCLMNKYVVYLSYYGFMAQFDKTVDITFYILKCPIFLEKTQTSYTKFIVLWPYQSQ